MVIWCFPDIQKANAAMKRFAGPIIEERRASFADSQKKPARWPSSKALIKNDMLQRLLDNPEGSKAGVEQICTRLLLYCVAANHTTILSTSSKMAGYNPGRCFVSFVRTTSM